MFGQIRRIGELVFDAAHGESVNRDPLGLKRGDLAADEAVRRSRIGVDQIADSQVSAPNLKKNNQASR